MTTKFLDPLLLLIGLNVIQPATAENIMQLFSHELSEEQINDSIGLLLKKRLINKFNDGQFVLTYKGYSALRPNMSSKRDIRRMSYLFDRIKGG
jgi:hypothetical protein